MADVVAQAINEGRVSDETAAYLNEVVDEDDDGGESGGYLLGTDVYVPSFKTTCQEYSQRQDSLRLFPSILGHLPQAGGSEEFSSWPSDDGRPSRSQGSLKRKRRSEQNDSRKSNDSPRPKRIRASIDREAQVEAEYDFAAETQRLHNANE